MRDEVRRGSRTHKGKSPLQAAKQPSFSQQEDEESALPPNGVSQESDAGSEEGSYGKLDLSDCEIEGYDALDAPPESAQYEDVEASDSALYENFEDEPVGVKADDRGGSGRAKKKSKKSKKLGKSNRKKKKRDTKRDSQLESFLSSGDSDSGKESTARVARRFCSSNDSGSDSDALAPLPSQVKGSSDEDEDDIFATFVPS